MLQATDVGHAIETGIAQGKTLAVSLQIAAHQVQGPSLNALFAGRRRQLAAAAGDIEERLPRPCAKPDHAALPEGRRSAQSTGRMQPLVAAENILAGADMLDVDHTGSW